MRWKLMMLGFTLFSAMLMGFAIPIQAQNQTVITLSLLEFMRGFPVDEILAEFEAQNPGVHVQTVYTSFSDYFTPPAPDSLEDHLEGERNLAEGADVILVENNLSPFATRAGNFLDLSPLASADSTLNSANFLPAAWQSFQWDNGLWALPAKVEPFVLIFDRTAFDQAGLPYPTPNWTLDDLANAARVLTQRDASGAVTQPGFVSNGFTSVLLRSLSGISLTDANFVPHFYTPELQALLEQWSALSEEGIVAEQSGSMGGALAASAPMQITGIYSLLPFAPPGEPVPNNGATTLPGGSIGLSATGFAVSAGTAHPQEAYNLAKFLTQDLQILSLINGARPARNDVQLPSMTNEGPQAVEAGGGGMSISIGSGLPADVMAQMETLLPAAMPFSELRFSEYLTSAIASTVDGSSDAATALQNAEAKAIADLQTAAASRDDVPLIVATPVPTAVFNAGEIELHFGAGFTAQTGEWERLMREFSAADPEVGAVTLDTDFGRIEDYAERNDCFYLNYNAVPSADLSLLLPIDPLLTTDTTFSMSDVAGNALTQLQRDNRTWAYPLHISPEMLHYHTDLFAEAGVPEPTGGWTISSFVDALRAMRNIIPDNKMPFSNRSFGDTYLLSLIAAYGGLPLDFRTNPPTINFTDPTNVDAIRQVLDLAKNELIGYSELTANMFTVAVAFADPNPDPIFNQPPGLSMVMSLGGMQSNTSDPYRLVGYPTGTYTTTAYDIGSAYVSATSQNPNACYRLFRFLSSHPELFGSMPALRSQFTNPTLASAMGEAGAFYQAFDALMQDPNTIIIPSTFSGGGEISGMNITRRWLDKAFDEYVLNDADLLTALTEAQTKAEGFQTCMMGVPALDPANPQAYSDSLLACVTSVDPDMSEMFPTRAG